MDPTVETILSTVIAVFLGASPFLALGAVLSAIVEIGLPDHFSARYLPRGRLKGMFLGLGLGMLIPTCDCGVISLMRRLLKKGVSPTMAITYLFSAPVINPLVLASTYVAFRGDIRMVLGRAGIVAGCACLMGLLLGRTDAALLLRENAALPEESHHAHAPHDACGIHGASVPSPAAMCACGVAVDNHSKIIQVFTHAVTEFLDMGRYLIVGAFAVAFAGVLLPHDLLLLLQDNLFLAVGAMMLLAVIVSVCSEADAFIAASFVMLPAAAKLSFLAIGPMVDLKLIIMYASVFRWRTALACMIIPTVFVYLVSVLLGAAIG